MTHHYDLVLSHSDSLALRNTADLLTDHTDLDSCKVPLFSWRCLSLRAIAFQALQVVSRGFQFETPVCQELDALLRVVPFKSFRTFHQHLSLVVERNLRLVPVLPKDADP